MWAVDNEENECGDRENQGEAPCVEGGVEARREGSAWGGCRETTEESCLLIVGRIDGAALVGEKGSMRRGHCDKV